MKAKYKDLLKNKWGWVGAVAGFLTLQLLAFRNCFPQGCAVSEWYSFGSNNLRTLFEQTPIPDVIEKFYVYGIWIIGGFILGLILQKLWRKIK